MDGIVKATTSGEGSEGIFRLLRAFGGGGEVTLEAHLPVTGQDSGEVASDVHLLRVCTNTFTTSNVRPSHLRQYVAEQLQGLSRAPKSLQCSSVFWY